jgi:hypothetical protein
MCFAKNTLYISYRLFLPNKIQILLINSKPKMPVQTRSQSVKKSVVSYEPLPKENDTEPVLQDSSQIPVNLLFEVNIDFDEASVAWRSNKRRVGESWVYRKRR